MRFCSQFDKLKHISHEEFEYLKWLPVTFIFKQCVNLIALKYFNKQCLNCLHEVFDVAIENNVQLRGSFLTPVNLLCHILVQFLWGKVLGHTRAY